MTLGADIPDAILKRILNDFGLGNLNIDEKYDEKNSGLSGGQKQRINLARGILNNDKILLLDEVTSSLDKKSVQIIEEAIIKYDKTVIFVTHNVTSFMSNNVDHIYSLT